MVADRRDLPSRLPTDEREPVTDERKPVCDFCNRPAVALCDWVIGFTRQGWHQTTAERAWNAERIDEFDRERQALPTIGEESEMFTCDAALCEQCGTRVGMTTVQGVDSVDHCPHHVGKAERIRCLTEAEADNERRRARLRIAED